LALKAPYYIELAGLKDFGRLVCALERMPLPAFSLEISKEKALAVQIDIINGRPVIYYVKNESPPQYIAYRTGNGVEEVLPVDSVVNPTFVYSPVINIDKYPSVLSKSAKATKSAGYTVIRLKDLSSLAKVAAYKTVYDEPPLPLFLFKDISGKFVLGATMSLNESDISSYFYYVALDDEPKDPFLRFSSQKVEQPVFSSRLDEHGYIYLKIIRLAGTHPLVKAYG
jgi:hypothetical protein